MKKIVFAFGRYNPPTTGHAELITYAVKLAHKTGADHRIYTSNSHDPSKNPLSPRQKVAFLKQIFPGVNFIADPSLKTAFAICKKLVDEGYEDVTFVVGDDRVAEFSRSLGKYVKPRTAKGFDPKIHYPFKNFKVVSSGGRKQGISGTALRAAVRKGDFNTFAKASAARDKSLARKIFTATKQNLMEGYVEEASQRDITKLLTTRGWKLHRRGTNHDIYSHEKGTKRITVPRHGGELDRRLSKEIDKQTVRYIREEMSRKDFSAHLDSFVDFCCNKLSILDKPKLKFKEPHDQGEQPSFAAYAPGAREVHVMSKNRHPMDIFRSVAHELVHHKQNEEGRIGKDVAKEGATGSDIENEANSKAGELMRWYGKAFPASFNMSYVVEN
ncbi:addiction module toxin, HicA family, partial [bacterium]|nr:addiction module toxin, HicA family [bacterium]